MNIKNHPQYWYVHKKIYQEEYDNLNPAIREIVSSDPYSKEAKDLELKVSRNTERELLFSVE
jgi:hypothetical protein